MEKNHHGKTPATRSCKTPRKTRLETNHRRGWGLAGRPGLGPEWGLCPESPHPPPRLGRPPVPTPPPSPRLPRSQRRRHPRPQPTTPREGKATLKHTAAPLSTRGPATAGRAAAAAAPARPVAPRGGCPGAGCAGRWAGGRDPRAPGRPPGPPPAPPPHACARLQFSREGGGAGSSPLRRALRGTLWGGELEV